MNYQEIWWEKYRPTTLAEMALDPEIRAHFEGIAAADVPCIPHLLFYGHAGGGKSTLARILIKTVLKCDYIIVNASEENGVDAVREKIIGFCKVRSLDNVMKVVLLEEADGLSSNSGTGTSAQQILKNVMEEYSGNVRFILTCNDIHKIIAPIKSRMNDVYRITPPKREVAKYVLGILKNEHITFEPEDLKKMLNDHFPDVRKLVGVLQERSATGKLTPTEDSTTNLEEFVDTVFKSVQAATPEKGLFEVRSEVMNHELLFGADYRIFLKSLFNRIYENVELPANKKANLLLIVADSLVKHEAVVDREINAFGTLIQVCLALRA